MRVAQQPAYVLHHYSYRETSLVLEVLTRGYGRIGLLAKGARRSRPRQRVVLEPFQPLLVGWVGRGDLPILAAAELDGEPTFLSGTTLYCAFYMNELLLRLLHRHDPHERLFDAYRAALRVLRDAGPVESTLRVFEKRLLQEIGYGLVLERSMPNDLPLDPGCVYEYQIERGPTAAGTYVAEAPAGSILIKGSSLLALANETLDGDPVALQETKALLRVALERRLPNKPLHSRKLFRELRSAVTVDRE